MERQMMPTEDGVAPPWNRTNPSPATPGVLTARCYAILHYLANKLLEYSASLDSSTHTASDVTRNSAHSCGNVSNAIEFNYRYVFHVDYSKN